MKVAYVPTWGPLEKYILLLRPVCRLMAEGPPGMTAAQEAGV